MNTRDAWTLRRLLSGLHVNGEMENVSKSFRPIADRLAALPVEDRHAVWDDFVAFHDADGLNVALAAVDPEESAPGPDEEGPDGWESIRLDAMPPASPFPLDVLPEAAAQLAREGADAIGCPPDFIAASMLAVAAGTIGRSVSLLLKRGYFVRACLYVVCVGPPSMGKTPAFKVAAEAIRHIASALEAEHEERMVRWKEEEEAKKGARSTPPPKPRRIDVDDITTEALVMRLADNPRGLFMGKDELSALLLGMNQYKGGKGNDLPTYLKIRTGDKIARDRVSDSSGIPVICPHPCLTILGGLVPDNLRKLQDDRSTDDGFVDRFSFVFPEPIVKSGWSEVGIPDSSKEAWREIVDRLWMRPMEVVNGQEAPHVARLTNDGMATWKARYDAHVAEMNSPDFPPSLAGPWGKLESNAGELALILACLQHAADPTIDPTGVPVVGREIVQDAWRLVEYYKNHFRRARMTIAQGRGIGGSDAAKAIVDLIRDRGCKSISESEIKQARRWISPDELAEALAYLADRNAIRLRATPPGPRQGRPPKPVFEVNPALWTH